MFKDDNSKNDGTKKERKCIQRDPHLCPNMIRRNHLKVLNRMYHNLFFAQTLTEGERCVFEKGQIRLKAPYVSRTTWQF